MNNTKATIIALAAALLLLVANASERLVYAFSDLPFLVRIGMGIAFVAVLVILLLHGFEIINIYQIIFQK